MSDGAQSGGGPDYTAFVQEIGALRTQLTTMHLEVMGEVRRLEREGMARSERITRLETQHGEMRADIDEIKKSLATMTETLDAIIGIIRTWRGGFVAIGVVGATATAIVAYIKGWFGSGSSA